MTPVFSPEFSRALQDVNDLSSKRLSDMLQPLEHSEIKLPNHVRPAIPVIPQGDPVAPDRSKQKMADAFNEPERVKSDTPRENNKCKDRPKSNRSKIGGAGKKRFIPWC